MELELEPVDENIGIGMPSNPKFFSSADQFKSAVVHNLSTDADFSK